MDYINLSKEDLIKIIENLSGRLEVHNQKVKDIRARTNQKVKIDNMEKYWKRILDALPVSVSLQDSIGYISLNKYGTKIGGYTEEEWINMSEQERSLILELPAKPETLIFLDMMTRQGKNPETDMVELEFKLKTKDGRWLWLYSTNSYVFNPIKNDYEFITAATDVTDRVNNELEIKRLNSELQSTLDRERNLAEEKHALMEKQIADKNRELNRLAVYLTEKNNCLLKLKNQAASFSNAGKDELKKIAEDFVKSIDSKLNNQSVWNTFEIQFETANPHYMRNLLKLYPDLSYMELKICTLIKLDLSTKAISTMLNLSTRTVDSHRYSIRKKMQLKKDDQLSIILNSVINN